MSSGSSSFGDAGPTWQIPLWRPVVVIAVALPLSLLIVRAVVLAAAMPARVVLFASAGSFVATVISCLIGLALFVLLIEAVILSVAALFSRKAHAILRADEFWHFQLKHPIALASVRQLTVHGSSRTRGIALTISTEGSVSLRFPSIFNLKRLICPGAGCRQFTFAPGFFADTDEFIRVLAQVVRLHGGTVTNG